jgi:hypothetical protein
METQAHGPKPFLALEIASRTGYHGQQLVERVLDLVTRLRPTHITLAGGEPLVLRDEIGRLLPEFDRLGIEVQLVTNALAPIPPDYGMWDNLHIIVEVKATPATYCRVLDNICGQSVVVHCTITKKLANAPNRLRDFASFWSSREEVCGICFSLHTPQDCESGAERFEPGERQAIVEELASIRRTCPKVYLPDAVLAGFLHPPSRPGECAFAQMTLGLSADLISEIVPCPLGGRPVCAECGSIASAALVAAG